MKSMTASTAAMASPTGGPDDRGGDGRTDPAGAAARPRRGGGSRSGGTGPRSDRSWTLQVAAMEYTWLYDYRHGIAIKEIAARANVTVGRVRFGVERAKAQESQLSGRDVIQELKSGRLDDI